MAAIMMSRMRSANRIGWRQHEVIASSLWEHSSLGSNLNDSRRFFARKRGSSRGPSSIDADFYDSLVRERQAEEKVSTKSKGKSIVRALPKSAMKIHTKKQEFPSDRRNSTGYDRRSKGASQAMRGQTQHERQQRIPDNAQRQSQRRWQDQKKTAKDEDLDVEEVFSKRMFRGDWVNRKDKPFNENQKMEPNLQGGKEHLRNRRGPNKHNTDRTQPAWKAFKGSSNNFHGKPSKDGPTANELWANFPPNGSDVFVSCLPGLEPLLAQEMKDLGVDCHIEAGGVMPTKPLKLPLLHLCHLHLGTASHILLRCGKPFTARGLPELTRKVSRQPWHQFIDKSLPVAVKVTSKKSKLNHNTAIRAAVLEGINLSLNSIVGNRKQVSRAQEADKKVCKLVVRIDHDDVQISIDTWDTPMHKRGYRLETAKAPLREDLAFAMVYGAGWRMHDPDNQPEPPIQGMLDPFCGSGTIAIEAATIAAGLPPGRLKGPPLYGTVWHKPKKWNEQLKSVLHEASTKKSERMVLQIAASDRDAGAIEAASANAERAGVQDWINFAPISISHHEWLTPNNQHRGCYPCLVATNPPWGLRLSVDKTNRKKKKNVHPLLPLYQTLIGRQNLLNEEGRQVLAVTLLQDPKLFRKTGADMKVMWSSQHGGIPVAAVFTGEPVDTTAINTKEAGLKEHLTEEPKQSKVDNEMMKKKAQRIEM